MEPFKYFKDEWCAPLSPVYRSGSYFHECEPLEAHMLTHLNLHHGRLRISQGTAAGWAHLPAAASQEWQDHDDGAILCSFFFSKRLKQECLAANTKGRAKTQPAYSRMLTKRAYESEIRWPARVSRGHRPAVQSWWPARRGFAATTGACRRAGQPRQRRRRRARLPSGAAP